MRKFLTLAFILCSSSALASVNGTWAGKVNSKASDGYNIDIDCKIKMDADSLFVRIVDSDNCTYLANQISEFEIDGHDLLSGNTKVGTLKENGSEAIVELFESYTDGEWRLTLTKNSDATLSVKELYTETSKNYSEIATGNLTPAK